MCVCVCVCVCEYRWIIEKNILKIYDSLDQNYFDLWLCPLKLLQWHLKILKSNKMGLKIGKKYGQCRPLVSLVPHTFLYRKYSVKQWVKENG